MNEVRDVQAKKPKGRGVYVRTPEIRARISAGLVGRKLSAETKARISATMTGKAKTREHASNISAALRGRKFSDEHRANISAGRKATSGRHRMPDREDISPDVGKDVRTDM